MRPRVLSGYTRPNEFLVCHYKKEFYYWDCVEIMRKVVHVLAGLLSILGPVQEFFAGSEGGVSAAAPGSQFQLLVGIFTSTIFTVWVGTRKPFNEEATNGFKVWNDGSGSVSEAENLLKKS